MALLGKNNNQNAELNRLASYMAQGYALDRITDFEELVKEFRLAVVSTNAVRDRVEQQLPPNFGATIMQPTNSDVIYLFKDKWKAVLEQIWSNDGVSCFRFWFAEPTVSKNSSERAGVVVELNIAATAVEKSLLMFDPATYAEMRYVSEKEREFVIGPAKTHSMSFSVGMVLGAAPWIRNKMLDTALNAGGDAYAEYRAETKSAKMLGSDSLGYSLAKRYDATPACPANVVEFLAQQAPPMPQPAPMQQIMPSPWANPMPMPQVAPSPQHTPMQQPAPAPMPMPNMTQITLQQAVPMASIASPSTTGPATSNYCAYCGTPLAPHNKFCCGCGRPIV